MKDALRERFTYFTKVIFISMLISLLSLVPGLPGLSLLTERAFAVVDAVTNTDTGEGFSDLQSAINDSDTDSGDTIQINQNLVTTSQVTITKSIIINGDGNTIDADFIKTNNSNNSALGVQADNVTIENVTVMSSGDQPWPNQLHGINVYQSVNVTVSNVTAKDFYGTGIAYNGSTGTIQDVHTENNTWHGINIDKDGSDVSVIGTNTHNEIFADIYVDNDTLNVQVYAPAYDWERSGIAGRDNDRVYRLLPPIETCNTSVFDSGFSNGSVNGQNGWQSTGPFDQEITDNRYGYAELGCKVLRISNSVTSGSFGNQTFSAPASALAGENVTNDHYEASFTFGTTEQSEQAGLGLSVSPDDGIGNRMSYVSLADTSSGTSLTFYDTDINGVFQPTALGVYDRTDVHTVKFIIDFNDGEYNDVVEVYVDGVLVHTGTTWEQYYRYSPEQAGNGNVVPSVDRLIFRSAGTAVPSHDGEGYIFDNVSTTTSQNTPPDTTKPLTTVLSPLNYSSQNSDFTIGVNSTDSESGIAKAVVNVYDNNGFLFPCLNQTVSPTEADYNFSCEIDVDALSDGTYYIKTNTRDGANNISNTVTHYFTVDTTNPVITVKPGFSGDELAKVFREVSFKLYDSNAADKYVLNGTERDFTNNKWSDANYQNIKNLLIQGANELVLYDVAGNSTTYTFTYDTQKPSVTIDAPSNGAPVASTFTVNGTASDSTSSITQVNYTVNEIDSLGGSFVANGPSGTATGTNTWTFDVIGLTEGFYRVKVQAFDQAGNWRYKYHDVVVDNTAPTITIKSQSIGSEPIFSNVSFKLYDLYNIDKVTLNGVVKDLSNNKWSDLNNVQPGSFGAVEGANTLVVYDEVGNSTTYLFTLDTTAPAVTINAIPSSTNTTPTITGTVDDATAEVAVTVAGTEYTTTNNGDGTWTFTVPVTLSVGDYTVEASATDLAENTSTPVATTTFTVEEEETPEEPQVLGETTTVGQDISTPTSNNGGIGGDLTGNPLLAQATNTSTDVTEEENEQSEDEEDGGEVLQSTTDEQEEGENTNNTEETNDECFKLLGLCWYWWAIPVVIVLLVIGYRIFIEEE